ncbi:MAG: hypothetical protein AB1512_02990 [Thermodesulfobacteriota bacterium]
MVGTRFHVYGRREGDEMFTLYVGEFRSSEEAGTAIEEAKKTYSRMVFNVFEAPEKRRKSERLARELVQKFRQDGNVLSLVEEACKLSASLSRYSMYPASLFLEELRHQMKKTEASGGGCVEGNGRKVVAYPEVQGSIDEMRGQFREQLADFTKKAEAGEIICLTDLMANAEKIHLAQVEKAEKEGRK